MRMKHVLLASTLALLACGASQAVAAEPTLKVAVQTDLPPYVTDGATAGLEIDLLRAALGDAKLSFVQMPYAELQTAVKKKRAGVAVAVQQLGKDDGVFYSREFVTFENAAITKVLTGMAIANVAELAGHEVLAWQDAYRELGPEFEKLYRPGGPERARYTEFGDQVEQVRAFWAKPDAIAVIDRAVFNAFTTRLGHSPDDVIVHTIFPPVTSFRVAFADAKQRDAFDAGIVRLCKSGEYTQILARHGVVLSRTVCDG